MATGTKVSLTIERLSRDKLNELSIHSAGEIQFLLQDMRKKKTRAALYYDGGNSFIMTRILFVNDEGIWLDIGPHEDENERILRDHAFTLVSLHQHVKVQFGTASIVTALYNDKEAFYTPLPKSLVRIQRREYFRLSIPIGAPIACAIPLPSSKPDAPPDIRKVNILDISCGGIALLCDEQERDLQRGSVFKKCRIALTGSDAITVTIEVMDSVDFATPNGVVIKRVGCQFVHPDAQTLQLLQNYINRQQLESMVRD